MQCPRHLGWFYRGGGRSEQARQHLTTATDRHHEMDMHFRREKAGPELTAST
jgi:hypothetical protein